MVIGGISGAFVTTISNDKGYEEDEMGQNRNYSMSRIKTYVVFLNVNELLRVLEKGGEKCLMPGDWGLVPI